MSRQSEEKVRAWAQARVEAYGSIDKAWPRDEFTASAWRELCQHFGLGRASKAATLEEALARVAELAN